MSEMSVTDLTEHIRATVPAMLPNIAERIAESLLAPIEARQQEAREEGLAIAEYLLRKVVDYWDGRPVEHHGHHVYADLLDVLRAITPTAEETA